MSLSASEPISFTVTYRRAQQQSESTSTVFILELLNPVERLEKRKCVYRTYNMLSLQHIREDSYISRSPSILTVACLEMDQVVVLSTWVIVPQQSYLPLRVQHKHYGA